MTAYSVRVFGIPRPQGSKRGFVSATTGKVVMLEMARAVKGWREEIAYTFQQCEKIDGAAVVNVEFIMHRPLRLRPGMEEPHIAKPDADKLLRAVFDALTMSGIVKDDSYIVAGGFLKRYADHGEKPGALITVGSL